MSGGESYWMGMSEDEYKVLSYILFNMGPGGVYQGDYDSIAQALDMPVDRVREVLQSLAQRRILRIAEERQEGPAERSTARLFEELRNPQSENEVLSYLRKEVRALYLMYVKSLSELSRSAKQGGPEGRLVERAYYYSMRLAGYRNLGKIVLDRVKRSLSDPLLGFDDKLKLLYEVTLYLYPIVPLVTKTVEAPTGERISIVIPSQKALSSRLRSLEAYASSIAEVMESAESPVRIKLGGILLSLKEEYELLSGLSEALSRLEKEVVLG